MMKLAVLLAATLHLAGAQAAGPGCSAPAVSPGATTFTVESGGAARKYVAYLPGGYAPARAMPVVLDFHGSGSTPEQELAISGMGQAAEERGFIVVLPVAVTPFASGGHTWNVPRDERFPDDVRYVRDVLDDVPRRLCIDESRVYAAGFSGGARLASEVACELSDRIAALAAVGGLRMPSGCARAVPVIAFHGTRDPINPYAGDGPDYWRYGIDEAFDAWVRQNLCRARPDRDRLEPDVARLEVADCADGSSVTLYRIEGGGHIWPGSAYPLPSERFGVASDTIDATGLMLDFFWQFRLGET